MSSLLEQVVEDLRSLSREAQDRVAEVVVAYLNGLHDDFRLMA
jgi:tRNA uridine 5-carbamoylmethylation protein Kti12